MAHPVRPLAAALLLLSLGGCIRGVAISVSGPLAAPVVVVKPAWVLDPEVCLTELSIEAGAGNDVWRARAKDFRCQDVQKIVFAAAPGAFENLVAPQPLRAGTVYTVDVRGSGWLGREAFVFADGRWRTAKPLR